MSCRLWLGIYISLSSPSNLQASLIITRAELEEQVNPLVSGDVCVWGVHTWCFILEKKMYSSKFKVQIHPPTHLFKPVPHIPCSPLHQPSGTVRLWRTPPTSVFWAGLYVPALKRFKDVNWMLFWYVCLEQTLKINQDVNFISYAFCRPLLMAVMFDCKK